MFRWLRERRKRRENEARKAREQLRRKAGFRPPESTFMESLVPDEMTDGVAERFATQLVAQEVQATGQHERSAGSHTHSLTPVNTGAHSHSPGNHSHRVMDGSLTHSFDNSHSHSHSHSHDSGSHSHSYDSSSGASDGGGGW